MTISQDFSYVSSSDNSFIDGLYLDYKNNPDSVDNSWKQFFKGLEYALVMPSSATDSTSQGVSSSLSKEFKVYRLIEAYRARGHLVSTTNPIRERVNRFPKLDLEDHGLSNADLDESFAISAWAKECQAQRHHFALKIYLLRNYWCRIHAHQ